MIIASTTGPIQIVIGQADCSANYWPTVEFKPPPKKKPKKRKKKRTRFDFWRVLEP